MKRVVKWLKSPWGISLGTAVFSLMLTVIYDASKSIPVLSTICSIAASIWNLVLMALNLDLKLWWILVGIISITGIVYGLRKISYLKSSASPKLGFLEYTQDNIHEWLWSWAWVKQYDGKFAIEDLRPICPKCRTPFVRSYTAYEGFVCPRCGYEPKTQYPNDTSVRTLIVDNARKGLFANNIAI